MRIPGAPWIGLPYAEQLERKRALLRDAFHTEVPLTPHPNPLGYRNAVEFVCTPAAVGMKLDGDWQTVVDLESHPLAMPAVNDALRLVRSWISEAAVECVPLGGRTGWLRYVHIRSGEGVQVALSTRTSQHESLVEDLWSLLGVESLVWMVTADDSATGEVVRVFGAPEIPVSLADKAFLIDPFTFFQASPVMASLAVERMRGFLPPGASVLDLYCGVGAIGIALAPARLVGVDEVLSSVERARRNAERNAVDAEFVAMDAQAYLASHPAPEAVVVDPPRRGLGHGVFGLLAAAPELILYLSCNPVTQARDLAALGRAYEVVHLEGFDFFPQTPHVESLAILHKK